MLEIEKEKKFDGHRRLCLATVDQNVIRSETVENELSSKPGIGK